MYYLLKGDSTLKFSSNKLKPYVKPGAPLSKQQKLTLMREVVEEEYKNYVNKRIGSYVCINSLEVLDLLTGLPDYDSCIAKVKLSLFFYRVNVKDIVRFKVQQINQYGLKGFLHQFHVEVPVDQLSVVKPIYNSTQRTFTIGEKKIKEQDEIKIKVTSFYNVIDPLTKRKNLVLKGSCRNTGLGK